MTSHGEFYADKIMDLANLAAAALVFGQVADGHFRWLVLGIGVFLFLLCVVLSYQLRKGSSKSL